MTRLTHTIYVVLVLGGLVVCYWRAQQISGGIADLTGLIIETRQLSQESFAMYSSIIFTKADGTTTTYTGVTGYSAHESYVSFTGKGPGDEAAKDYEINRTAFSSVQKIPE